MAQVAGHIDQEIETNWKVVWENNRGCFHCDVNHPEYIQGNDDHQDGDGATAVSPLAY